ncbi:MAG: S9 family peptidase, partial [Acidobacteria bacterium]
MMRHCSLLMVVLCATAPAYAQKRAFTLEDLYRIRSIGDVQVSPDGARAVYTVTTSDLPRGKRTTHIWLLELASGQTRQLTWSDASTAPIFSPDGRSLAFVSTRDGDANLYLLSLDGGEAKPLTHIS